MSPVCGEEDSVCVATVDVVVGITVHDVVWELFSVTVTVKSEANRNTKGIPDSPVLAT